MASFIDKIDINIKRKLIFATIAVAGASHIWLFQPMFSRFMDYEIWGHINVASVVGIVTVIGIWLVYKRRL